MENVENYPEDHLETLYKVLNSLETNVIGYGNSDTTRVHGFFVSMGREGDKSIYKIVHKSGDTNEWSYSWFSHMELNNYTQKQETIVPVRVLDVYKEGII